MTVYTVVAVREGEKWTADVPDVPGAHTWARSIAALDAAVREVIALVLDLPEGAEEGLHLSWKFSTGDTTMDEITEALRVARQEVDAKASALAARTQEVATELAETFSVRDVAALLGVSYQRVAQVAPKGKALKTTAPNVRVMPARAGGGGSRGRALPAKAARMPARAARAASAGSQTRRSQSKS